MNGREVSTQKKNIGTSGAHQFLRAYTMGSKPYKFRITEKKKKKKKTGQAKGTF